jgi:hypothetical protein
MENGMKNLKLFNFKVLVIVACLFFPASFSLGAIVPETHLATGKVAAITNKEIKLDTGETFLPSQVIKEAPYQRGDTVTLRYFVHPDGKNVYIEIAPGANSLPEPPPPPPAKTDLM